MNLGKTLEVVTAPGDQWNEQAAWIAIFIPEIKKRKSLVKLWTCLLSGCVVFHAGERREEDTQQNENKEESTLPVFSL